MLIRSLCVSAPVERKQGFQNNNLLKDNEVTEL